MFGTSIRSSSTRTGGFRMKIWPKIVLKIVEVVAIVIAERRIK